MTDSLQRSGAPCVEVRGASRLTISVHAHDLQYLDTELAYPMRPDRSTGHVLDLFLFVPRNIGITPQSYSREDFYRDLGAYLRADSPPLDLAQLADEGCADSPLQHLDQSVRELEGDIHARPRRPIIMLVRLFGHAFCESVRRAQRSVLQLIDQIAALPSPERQTRTLVEALDALGRGGYMALLRFRQIRRRFAPLAGARPVVVHETFEHVDDHTSAFLLEQLQQVAAHLQQRAELHDGGGMVLAGLLSLARAAEHVARERWLEGFVFPAPDNPRVAEFFSYRRRRIRRSMERTFYLETRALRRDPYVRNAIAMAGAGLAAIWSLVAQVPATLSGMSEQTRLAVLGSAVLAYMLKDRIKELTKERLAKGVRRYDHDNVLVGDNLVQAGLRGVSGRARERMRWLGPGDVPAPVLKLRTYPRTATTADIAAEQVIAYQRTLTAGPEPGQVLPAGFALRDVIRLNLHQFMVRLDEPRDQVGYYDLQRRRYLRVATPKVYHLNLVVQLQGQDLREPIRQRYRVVLDKERILRIEPVTMVAP